jgi:hypothetical protein
MLVLLACLGDEAAAGYHTIMGSAHVDAETGRNAFVIHSFGRHCYAMKSKPDAYYRDTINNILERKV